MGQFIQSPTHSTTSNVVRPSHTIKMTSMRSMASGLIVTINARVATKEPTPVPERIGAGEQIDVRNNAPAIRDAGQGVQWQDQS